MAQERGGRCGQPWAASALHGVNCSVDIRRVARKSRITFTFSVVRRDGRCANRDGLQRGRRHAQLKVHAFMRAAEYYMYGRDERNCRLIFHPPGRGGINHSRVARCAQVVTMVDSARTTLELEARLTFHVAWNVKCIIRILILDYGTVSR